MHWIRKDPRDFKIFVATRLGEINENSEISEWRWVPTAENPADDSTRDTHDALDKGSRWLEGPSFLRQSEIYWPKESLESNFAEVNSDCLEIKRIVAHVSKEDTTLVSPVIDISRYSTWKRLIAVVTRVYQVIDYLRKIFFKYKYKKRDTIF